MTSPFQPPSHDPELPEGHLGRRLIAWAIDLATVFLFASVLPLLFQFILLFQGTTLGTKLVGLTLTGSVWKKRIRSFLTLLVGLIGAVGCLWVIMGVSNPIVYPDIVVLGVPMMLLALANAIPLWLFGFTALDSAFGVRLERRAPLSSTPTKDWSPPTQHDPFSGALGGSRHVTPEFEEPPEEHVLRVGRDEDRT